MQLRAMTYNLKFGSSSPQPGVPAWSVRRPLVAEALRRGSAHIVGTQEGLYRQLADICSDTGYRWVGLGREGGSHGEFCAILYDPALAELVEYDHFWLSDTPETIGSSTWGNHPVRMVTWARFVLDSRRLLWLNTHLDNAVEDARVRGAELIARRLSALRGSDPVIVSGDFNAAAGRSEAYRILTSTGLADAWSVAGRPELGTAGGWSGPTSEGDRIDWVLSAGLRVRDAGWIDHHVGELWPSDHVPVWADLLD